MLIYAHRGSSGTYPENTLLAFRQALESGASGIELDVHATADRAPVVIHDRALDRTTNGAGYIDQITLSALQQLDAGQGQRVPRLADVLELVGDKIHLDIEVKGMGIEREVLADLSRFPHARWAISSFDWDTLRAFRQIDATAELWPLAMDVDANLLDAASELGSPVVALYHEAYSEQNAERIERAGLRAMVWTVNAIDVARRMRLRGAYALCTDEPERVVTALHDG